MTHASLVYAFTMAAALALPSGMTAAQALQPQPGQTRAERMGIPASGHYTSFSQLDANKDGHITREEGKSSPAVTRLFGQIDKNGDGILSPEELQGWSFRGPAGLSYINRATIPDTANRGGRE